MKTRHILLLLAGLLLLGATGCKREKTATDTPLMREQFKRKTLPGLYQDTKTLYAMDKINDQLYYNVSNNTARIVSDDGSAYIEFALSGPVENLSLNGTTNVTISSKGKGDLPSYDNLEMLVLQKEDNLCWLWSSKRQLGAVIYYNAVR